jgi:hypothetical protein
MMDKVLGAFLYAGSSLEYVWSLLNDYVIGAAGRAGHQHGAGVVVESLGPYLECLAADGPRLAHGAYPGVTRVGAVTLWAGR